MAFFTLNRRIRRLRVVVCALVMILPLWGRAEPAASLPAPGPAESVALVRIIAAPEHYNGRRVTTAGVIMVGFEEDVLYLSREDARVAVMLNGIELIFSGPITREYAKAMNGKYVAVEGRFRVHQDLSSEITTGALTEITDIVSEDDWGRRE